MVSFYGSIKKTKQTKTKALNPTEKVLKSQVEIDETILAWNVAKCSDPILQTSDSEKTKLPTTSPFILNMQTISKKIQLVLSLVIRN